MVDKRDYNAQVLVLEDVNACNEQLTKELDKYLHRIVVVGLDCEWVSEERADSTPVCPVALVQLAFLNGSCFLVRLCHMNGSIPDKLKEILEDRNILKAGVGIKEDAKKLSLCYDFVVQGCVDLRHVASRCRGYVQYCFGEEGARNGMGLSALSQQILGVALDKDWRIRCSDWEAESLSERQIRYAAADAVVAVKIFIMLAMSKLKEKEERCNAGSGNALDQMSGSNTCTLSTLVLFQPSATHVLSETDNKQSMTSTEDERDKDRERQQLGSSNDSKELILDEAINPDRRTEGHSSLSGLLSKLDDLSLGYMFGVQGADPTVCSGQKSKLYPQYPSFKNVEMTKELLASSELWGCFSSLCQGIVDVPFKMKSKQKSSKGTSHGGGSKPVPSPAHAKNKLSGLKPRRAPLYENCVIEAPDGEMLSTCDKKKAFWYLSRELADVTKDDPYTITLKFEPSGRPLDPENNYYLTFKDNLCVVCGRDDSYMRKNIIPHDYRKHFPSCMKDHHSHDVLLLCPSCHMISTHYDDMLRKRLAEKYQAPLGNKASSQVARLVQDPVLKKVKCAAKALVYAGDKIPAKRREELLCAVKEFLEVESPTHEMLVKASEIETRQENCDFISHGQEVVEKVKDAGELLDFERMWREHFLENMKPKFLPSLWTVDHGQEKVKRLLQQELGCAEN